MSSCEKSPKLGSANPDDLSHLSEDEIDEILLPIPSESKLSNDILKSTPSEEDMKRATANHGFILASSIRERLAQHVPLRPGELDTMTLTAKLEALAIPQDLLDDGMASDEEDGSGSGGPSGPPATAREAPGKVKGFFQDLSSMWTFPEESNDNEGAEQTDKNDVSDDWDFGAVEAGVTNFFTKAISKGTSLIEKGATELANTIFKAETEHDEATTALEPGQLPQVPLPSDDLFEFNNYLVRLRGFGDLTLRRMKLDEDGDFLLLLQFNISQKPGLELKESIAGNSLFLKYGKDVAEIIVPEGKAPHLLKVKPPVDGIVMVETY